MPIVEDVMKGNEEANKSNEVRQEEKVIVEDVMEEDEVAEGKLELDTLPLLRT